MNSKSVSDGSDLVFSAVLTQHQEQFRETAASTPRILFLPRPDRTLRSPVVSPTSGRCLGRGKKCEPAQTRSAIKHDSWACGLGGARREPSE